MTFYHFKSDLLIWALFDAYFISDPIVGERLGGTKARNLIGKFVKFDPISGNKINADFDF